MTIINERGILYIKYTPWGIGENKRVMIMIENEKNVNNVNSEDEKEGQKCCHTKHTPRTEAQQKLLQNRLNRITGQLNGISRMLDENRYCGDILIQVAAVESALQSFGYIVLQTHMETCVVEEVINGNEKIMEETIELVKKLK